MVLIKKEPILKLQTAFSNAVNINNVYSFDSCRIFSI